MTSPESLRPLAMPATDNPLSIRGRFGRLSFIAWSAFLHFVFLSSSIALGLSMGIVNLSAYSLDPHWLMSLQGLSSLAMLIIFLLYGYFILVITVRRLHDMNRSGWWMLLLLVPVVNFLVWFYIVLGSGNQGVNQYGPARITFVWEKILAWLMILLTLLSLFTTLALFTYMSGGEQPQTPAELMQKTTEYF